MSQSEFANGIRPSEWTLFDKMMYGGLGYGTFCFPTDFLKVVIAIVFPPLGELLNIVDDSISKKFPYITWECFKKLSEYNNFKRLVYSFVLTTLFYIPGLVYVLTGIVEQQDIVPSTTKAQTFINIEKQNKESNKKSNNESQNESHNELKNMLNRL